MGGTSKTRTLLESWSHKNKHCWSYIPLSHDEHIKKGLYKFHLSGLPLFVALPYWSHLKTLEVTSQHRFVLLWKAPTYRVTSQHIDWFCIIFVLLPTHSSGRGEDLPEPWLRTWAASVQPIYLMTTGSLQSVVCTAVLCTALHCTTDALHYTALHYAALHCTAFHCTALYCTLMKCTALHCTALHCTHCITHLEPVFTKSPWLCVKSSSTPPIALPPE